MLTREDGVHARALHRQGWTIRDRPSSQSPIRVCLRGDRIAGERAPAGPDYFADFVTYCQARLIEGPHLWAMTLSTRLSTAMTAPTRRSRALGPGSGPRRCEPCRPTDGRASPIIEHPPAAETQFDRVELPNPPASWAWAPYGVSRVDGT